METKNLKELKELRSEQFEIADKAVEEGKVDESKDAMQQIKELDERIKKIEEELDMDKKDEDDKKEDKPVVEKEDDIRSNTNEGEKRMSNQFKPSINNQETESAELRGFMDFVRSQGEKRDQVTTVGAEAVIPDDIVTVPVTLPEQITDLKSLVNVIKVNNGAGTYPVLATATEKMISVAELAANPELAKPNFTNVNYSVETYRGQVPISEEALQDSTPDLANIVAQNNAMMALNTNNAAIAGILKTAPAKAATGTDSLKDILNVDLDPAYNISIICSQSFFNDVDKLKDSQGQYILQNDISSPSGKKLFGRNVVVISDVLLGAAGESKAFIGDAKQFCLFADRFQASVKFVQNDIFGTIMMISQRMDVVASNMLAGYFVTLTITPEI